MGNELPLLLFTRAELDAVLQRSDHTPEDVLRVLDRTFKARFDSSAGVWEAYSLRRHTLMVMGQFRKYFTSNPLPGGVSFGFFELILALHDIGKPEAIREGDKRKQHGYTIAIIHSTLTELGYNASDVAFATALINGDAIGQYLRNGNLLVHAQKIVRMATQTSLNVRDFWQLLQIYFQVDAGSYTEDAGGFYSLDWLFVFHHKARSMTFAPATLTKIAALEQEISRLTAI